MAGCSGVPTNDPDDGSNSASSADGGNAPGAPNRNHGSNGGGGGAAGAPIKIPARFDDQGRPLAEVSAEIESGVRDACGGDLCVTLRTVHRDVEGFTACQFIATEPPQRSFMKRGETLTIVSGSAPCEETSETGEPAESPSSSESTTP